MPMRMPLKQYLEDGDLLKTWAVLQCIFIYMLCVVYSVLLFLFLNITIYLSSNAGAWVTGAILKVDGGGLPSGL